VLVADDLDRARELWRTAIHPVTVVTLQGEAIDTLGAVSGGSAPPLEETILARARELRELKEALADNAARLVAEEAALSGMREALAESERELAAAEKRLQLVRVELVAAAKDREQLAAERERIAAELEVRALEAGGLEGEDGEMAGELAALAERERASGRTVRERREGLAQRQAALTAWHEEGAVAESARMEAAVRAAAIAERLSAARSRLGHWQASRREVEERAEVASAQAEEAGRGADVAASEAVTASAVRGEADRRVAALEEERGVLRAALADADAVLSTDDAAERTAREQLEAVREERSRIEVALAERRMAIENLAAQLVERYALGLDALAEVTLDDDGREDERAAQVETLRERLARLGDVNPAAVDELVALRGRHEFLSSQRADLEGSLDDLRRTIAKLTRASQQRFDDTFRAANEKLGEVFPKLFPGGTARLEARVPEDGDEPGIEIVVQPAGKKLQSLSLLSGGEKALTAVSLILSLFLIRPTPFCLLDEVDAPLDEANIGRFNQLVRELATASQFVLITHNRRTMEAADTLYGITMEQAGVSKIVSVRLREAA
jgi:chromosome segregation protein